jgi:hypothetical protein
MPLWLHGDTAHSFEPLSTLVLLQRLQLPGADQRTTEMKECGQDVSAVLVADREAPVGQQPGQGAFDLPALSAQPLAGLQPTAGDPRDDAPAAQRPPAGREVVSLVAMQLGWASARPTRPPSWPDDRRDRVDQLLQQQRVMGVGGREPDGQRDPGGIDQ